MAGGLTSGVLAALVASAILPPQSSPLRRIPAFALATRPDPAGTEIGVDGPDWAAGTHHRPQPLDPHLSHRAGGHQQADQYWWTGRGAGQGGPDDEQPGVLDR